MDDLMSTLEEYEDVSEQESRTYVYRMSYGSVSIEVEDPILMKETEDGGHRIIHAAEETPQEVFIEEGWDRLEVDEGVDGDVHISSEFDLSGKNIMDVPESASDVDVYGFNVTGGTYEQSVSAQTAPAVMKDGQKTYCRQEKTFGECGLNCDCNTYDTQTTTVAKSVVLSNEEKIKGDGGMGVPPSINPK